MPLTKSAIKKVRVDERRRMINIARQSQLRTLIKKASAEATFEAVSAAYAVLDKAVKVNLVHKSFANRNKAQLAKLSKPTKLQKNENNVKSTSKKNAAKSAAKTSKVASSSKAS
jgi:small subunit ribosomal protein S20